MWEFLMTILCEAERELRFARFRGLRRRGYYTLSYKAKVRGNMVLMVNFMTHAVILATRTARRSRLARYRSLSQLDRRDGTTDPADEQLEDRSHRYVRPIGHSSAVRKSDIARHGEAYP